MESDSGHPFSSPLSKNSRNTVYKVRFANVLGRVDGDLKTAIFETVPCRATPNTPFSALCPRILGTRFTNYGLRVSGACGSPFTKTTKTTQTATNKELSRGQKMNTNIFSSNFSSTAGISQRNPGISRQKSLISESLVSLDIPSFLAPTPSCGRPLPHHKIYGLKSLGLCSFFVPDSKAD